MSDAANVFQAAREAGGERCSSWSDVTSSLDTFPAHARVVSEDGEPNEQGWIFRGVADAQYPLAPSIEREAAERQREWAHLELRIYNEFRAGARVHMDPRDLPTGDDKLSWLASMQHYGAPTRLLDFTYSPYVALYFAVRNSSRAASASDAAVWAIDRQTLLGVSLSTSGIADTNDANAAEARPPCDLNPYDPVNFVSTADVVQKDLAAELEMASKALAPSNARRYLYNQRGFVGIALPPLQNRRLASQQGVFLFNGATDLDFEVSLSKMMATRDGWFRLLTIPSEARRDIEVHLWHANVHELSLFPDAQGFVQFVRQKIRLTEQ